jgi:uncharacterized 2Fe-2S/4Fe-4S cluster protein (DUF4445 family)
MKNIKVIFEPERLEVEVPEGSKIVAAIEKSGIAFELPCGGKGICGKCRVRVLEGASPPNETERKILGEKVVGGWRLACQSKITRLSRILIERPVLSYHKILSSKILCGAANDPHITKKPFILPEITLQDPVPLQEQVAHVLGVKTQAVRMRFLRAVSASGKNDFTAVFHHDELIGVEPGDTTGSCYGIGFDLGTTTMVLTLFDLNSCKELLTVVNPNPQIPFGDDVVSRIDFSMRDEGLMKLRKLVIDGINHMVDQVLKETRVERSHIYQFVLAGNTVMEQIFLELPLNSLSRIPFNPVMRGPVVLDAQRVGLKINPEGKLVVFPVIGGFVGGDTTGLILATGIHRSEKIQIGIDIGTNGEIVVGNRDGIIAASTAAGPAFEGGRISSGMRAQNGALEKCRYDAQAKKMVYQIIGGNSLRGICGTGLVDLVATLREQGVITPSGRFAEPDQVPQFNELLEKKDGRVFFKLEPTSQVVLTQKDIREFQAAKAAIRTGVEILLEMRGVKLDDVERIYLAGALGNFVNLENVRKIGLLPGMDISKVVPFGNTSLASTLLYLCNKKLAQELDEILTKTQVIELSLYPKFQEVYTDSLFL